MVLMASPKAQKKTFWKLIFKSIVFIVSVVEIIVWGNTEGFIQ